MRFAKVMKAMSAVRRVDGDDLLERLGLERRRSMFERVMTLVGIFGAGLVVGAGVSLLASPVAPADVRKKLGDGVRGVKREIHQGVQHAKHEVAETARTLGHAADARNGARPT